MSAEDKHGTGRIWAHDEKAVIAGGLSEEIILRQASDKFLLSLASSNWQPVDGSQKLKDPARTRRMVWKRFHVDPSGEGKATIEKESFHINEPNLPTSGNSQLENQDNG